MADETTEILMVDAKTAGVMCGLSARQVKAMSKLGKFPMPVQINKTTLRWRVYEIEKWVMQTGRK